MRTLLSTLTTLFLITSCGGDKDGPVSKEEAAKHPLVVVILCDTLRRDALSTYADHRGGETPNIDALAADGTRFEQAISTSGWTLPSVASILSGTYPSVHGASGRGARFNAISPELPLGQEVLKSKGWRTLAYINAAFLSGELGMSRGFDLFDHEEVYVSNIRRADVTVARALRGLDRAAGAPTFLLIHLFDPHIDYDPPAGWTEGLDELRGEDLPELPLGHADVRSLWNVKKGTVPSDEAEAYLRATYDAEVRALDAAIGTLLTGLKERGRYDDAFITLVADHGEEFWEHQGFEHGHSLYDELIRVPLIVKPPAKLGSPKAAVEAQVQPLDLFPTIFDALEITPPPTFDGASLLPLILETGESPTRAAFSEKNLYGDESLSWRSDRYKLIYSVNAAGEVREELYDWREDPGEERDLAQDPERLETLETLRAEMNQFRIELSQRGRLLERGDLIDLRPSQNAGYLEWKRMADLGYVGRELSDDEEDAFGGGR